MTLLRNPAHDLAGFWFSYGIDGRTYRAKATETSSYSEPKIHRRRYGASVTYEHTPQERDTSVLGVTIDLWSENTPALWVRPTVQNITDQQLEDARIYLFMDFDLGGPGSHNDDSGRYDQQLGVATMSDPTPVHVGVSARPKADAWDVTSPNRLRIGRVRRDLRRSSAAGPGDVAIGLQWNLGQIEPDGRRLVEIVIAAGLSPDETLTALNQTWERPAERSRDTGT